LADLIIDRLALPDCSPDMAQWEEMISKLKKPDGEVNLAIVGKYIQNGDAYLSITEALKHGGIANNVEVNIKWIESDHLEEGTDEAKHLGDVHGIVVPGGFGYRGIEGKIKAIRFARENKIPFLGLCLGMQCGVIEFARNVLGFERANSIEFDPDTPYPVITIMEEQKTVEDMGGTMRLGAYPCKLEQGSIAFKEYGADVISERHRHRYEFNNKYREQFIANGMRLSGLSPDEQLVEMVELEDHPWFVATQFHPEFKSKPLQPHPLFKGFISAALNHKTK
jgi:CTP synthase